MADDKRKVLIIDDNEEIRDLVNITLRGSEFEVHAASNGREGIQIAKELIPDIILLDIMMPGFDGFMTASVLRRNQTTRTIPIIFLSAKKGKEDIQQAIKVGGSDYIVKPFSPTDLMTRLRRKLSAQEIKAKGDGDEPPRSDADDRRIREAAYDDFLKKAIVRKGDVVVVKPVIPNLVIGNTAFYRGLFSNVISDGIFKIVFDAYGLQTIDSAGLALLISVDLSLAKYDGELRLTMPRNEVNGRFTYIKLNDMFNCFNTISETVASFSREIEKKPLIAGHDEINLCTACTYVNTLEARYCSYCGANLMLGGSEQILQALKRIIARKVFDDAKTTDITRLNTDRSILPDEDEIPSEFDVEIVEANFLMKYRSTRTVRKFYPARRQIAIEAPVLKNKLLPLQPGIKVLLSSTESGMHTAYETEIRLIDTKHAMMFVNYSDDAKVLHSVKNFSIAPAIPIPILLLNPSTGSTGDILHGKILELSRVRMVVFAEAQLPEDECLAIHFDLPHANSVNSPLVIPRKLRDRYMYEMEFVVIDERERSRIIQYMYSRQIEMAKVISSDRDLAR